MFPNASDIFYNKAVVLAKNAGMGRKERRSWHEPEIIAWDLSGFVVRPSKQNLASYTLEDTSKCYLVVAMVIVFIIIATDVVIPNVLSSINWYCFSCCVLIISNKELWLL